MNTINQMYRIDRENILKLVVLILEANLSKLFWLIILVIWLFSALSRRWMMIGCVGLTIGVWSIRLSAIVFLAVFFMMGIRCAVLSRKGDFWMSMVVSSGLLYMSCLWFSKVENSIWVIVIVTVILGGIFMINRLAFALNMALAQCLLMIRIKLSLVIGIITVSVVSLSGKALGVWVEVSLRLFGNFIKLVIDIFYGRHYELIISFKDIVSGQFIALNEFLLFGRGKVLLLLVQLLWEGLTFLLALVLIVVLLIIRRLWLVWLVILLV